jgi:hypothetical protein
MGWPCPEMDVDCRQRQLFGLGGIAVHTVPR